MPAKELLLGIDIGGTGCKAAVYHQTECLGQGYQEYKMVSTESGQAEQDGEEWWQATIQAIQQATANVDVQSIAAIGIGCTNGLICVNDQGRPIRPAIMLWDQRAYPQADQIKEKIGSEEIFRITGNPAAPGTYSLPTLLWLQSNEPDRFRDTYKFMVPGGYLVARLTDKFTIDLSRSCTTLLFDIRLNRWHEPFIHQLGIPKEKLPEPMRSIEIVGGVSAQAAEQTGLAQGTPVVTGCMDTLGAAVGAGSVRKGDYFIIMGTAARVCVVIDTPDFDPAFMSCVTHRPQRWLTFGAINGVGASLRWIRDVIAHEEMQTADQDGKDVYDLITSIADKACIGSNGLLYLPYLSGERTPIWDPRARGAFIGLVLGHSRADIYRSVLEGTAYAIRQSLELLNEKYHLPISHINIGGAAAKSAVWNQIIADVVGLPLHAITDSHIEVLGAALIAGMGVGLIDEDLKGVFSNQKVEVFKPNKRNQLLYSRFYKIYQNLYPTLRAQFHQINEIITAINEN